MKCSPGGIVGDTGTLTWVDAAVMDRMLPSAEFKPSLVGRSLVECSRNNQVDTRRRTNSKWVAQSSVSTHRDVPGKGAGIKVALHSIAAPGKPEARLLALTTG